MQAEVHGRYVSSYQDLCIVIDVWEHRGLPAVFDEAKVVILAYIDWEILSFLNTLFEKTPNTNEKRCVCVISD